MGKGAQRKGAGGEKELCRILQAFGFPVRRGGSLTYGTVPDVIGLRKIHIEVKRVEKLNLSAAMEQAERDAERFRDGLPAVFHRKNRGEWMVTMRLNDWLTLYRRYEREGIGDRKIFQKTKMDF